MKTQKSSIVIILLISLIFSSCSTDDDSCEIDCPEVNLTYPLLLGNWTFTGTIVNGNLLVEDCDLMTSVEITCNEFKYTSFSGDNCSESSSFMSNFRIEGDNIRYFEEEIGNDDFRQEIITLNTTTLVLKNNNGSSNDIVTENWTRQ